MYPEIWEILERIFFVSFFFILCSLNKTEKLKVGGGVAAAVMSFKDLRGKEK